MHHADKPQQADEPEDNDVGHFSMLRVWVNPRIGTAGAGMQSGEAG